jgi:hypothetical protein
MPSNGNASAKAGANRASRAWRNRRRARSNLVFTVAWGRLRKPAVSRRWPEPDGQTVGVRVADQALDVARSKRDGACGPGHGKSVACQTRQADVAKLEAKQTQATAKGCRSGQTGVERVREGPDVDEPGRYSTMRR